MTLRISKYWLAILAVASFAVGIVASPTVTTAIPPLGAEQTVTSDIEKFRSEISEEIKKLTNEINLIKNNADGKESEDIANLERQIKTADARIDRLNDFLSEDIDELKKDIASLKTLPQSQSQLLSVSLDRSEYRAGDSLIVSGIGSPNKSTKISLVDSNRFTISEGSSISDSSGKFTFTVPLSRNLADGNYIIRVNQDINSIEKPFRIASTLIQIGGFTLTTDSREYLRGERVLLSGTTDPNTWVDLDIFGNNNVQLVRTSTRSDANGRYSLDYTLASNAALGEYEVKATVGDKRVSVKFSVVSTKSSSSLPTSSNLIINTDRSTYNRGDFVTVTGKATANGKVTIFVEPPAGDKLALTVNADSSGNYRTVFEVRQDAFTGQWQLSVRQGTDTATIRITVI